MNLREVVREFELPAPNPVPVTAPDQTIPVEPSPAKEVPVEV
jgi:hypothetical protein